VISFDAAHLRIEYRGMLYIASLGLVWQWRHIPPLDSWLPMEDNDRCTKMLCLLKQACPIIAEQGWSQDVRSQTA
jgi:hypothetical protein